MYLNLRFCINYTAMFTAIEHIMKMHIILRGDFFTCHETSLYDKDRENDIKKTVYIYIYIALNMLRPF